MFFAGGLHEEDELLDITNINRRGALEYPPGDPGGAGVRCLPEGDAGG